LDIISISVFLSTPERSFDDPIDNAPLSVSVIRSVPLERPFDDAVDNAPQSMLIIPKLCSLIAPRRCKIRLLLLQQHVKAERRVERNLSAVKQYKKKLMANTT
jgi:hypothetical protein